MQGTTRRKGERNQSVSFKMSIANINIVTILNSRREKKLSIYNKNFRRFGPTIKKMNNLKKRSPPPLPRVPGKESTSPDPKTTPEVC